MKIAYIQPNYPVKAENQGIHKKNEDSTLQDKEQAASPEYISNALKDAKDELARMPNFNFNEVISIKTAIKEGRIKVDPETLAIAMLKYHQR